MALGPSRRSNNRLALDSSPPSPGDRDRADRFPDTPTRKYQDGPRVVGFSRKLDGKKLKSESSRRRIPFLMWLVSISAYCCIMYLRMGSFRALRQDDNVHQRDFQPKRSKEQQNPTSFVHEDSKVEPETSASLVTKQDEKSSTTTQSNAGIGTEIVHVVETRFMQGQSHLIELGLARLALFQAFCLPGMLSQSNQDFIWIIRADTNLHPGIRGTIVQMLEGRQNFIFMGSNSNPEGFGRSGSSFKDFLLNDPQIPDISTPIWSGNISMVEEAYAKTAADAVLLETRLDADDALQMNFIKTVQTEARQSLVDKKESNELWRLWCIHSNMEWHPLNPYPETPEVLADKGTYPEGYLVLYSDKGTCVTPGMTFGYGPGASRESLGFGRLKHDEIMKKVTQCTDDDQVKCVSRLTELVPGALRARTSTSAGMKNVITGKKEFDKTNMFKSRAKNKQLVGQYFRQDQLWKGLEEAFSISSRDPAVTYARSCIIERMREIAEDNLKGQCTPGHSCKNHTHTVLERLANA